MSLKELYTMVSPVASTKRGILRSIRTELVRHSRSRRIRRHRSKKNEWLAVLTTDRRFESRQNAFGSDSASTPAIDIAVLPSYIRACLPISCCESENINH